jgi:hypothetical protein
MHLPEARMRNAKSLEHPATSQSTQQAQATDPARRRFLFALGAGGAGAAAAKAGAMPVAIAPETATPSDQDAAYRESKHVRDYYRTTRI